MTKLENAKSNVTFWQKQAKHNLVGTLIGGIMLTIGFVTTTLCAPETRKAVREFSMWTEDVKHLENEQESCEETKES